MIFTAHTFKTLASQMELMGQDQLLQRILVPVDFSECSENAIRFATAVALRTGAEIKLFHSVHVPLQTAEMVNFPMAELEKTAVARLAAVVDEIVFWLDKERFPALKVLSQVTVGFAAEEIATQAAHDKTDLIVMGTHGTGALEGMLLGSNTTAVLQRVTCPVLVIPDDAEFQGFKKIVYASDMHEINAKAIQVLVHFASYFAAEIHVLHIVTNKDKLTPEQVDAYRKQFSFESGYVPVVYHIVDALDHSVAHAIEAYIEENKIDIVAIVTHHRKFFDKLFHPSITKKLAVHAKQPLLAFH